MADLERCPFCGRDGVEERVGHDDMTFFLCGPFDDHSAGCGAVVSFRPRRAGASARKGWNRRADSASLGAEDASHG